MSIIFLKLTYTVMHYLFKFLKSTACLRTVLYVYIVQYFMYFIRVIINVVFNTNNVTSNCKKFHRKHKECALAVYSMKCNHGPWMWTVYAKKVGGSVRRLITLCRCSKGCCNVGYALIAASIGCLRQLQTETGRDEVCDHIMDTVIADSKNMQK